MRFFKNVIVFLFCGFACFSQDAIEEELVTESDDLKYVLTYTFDDTVEMYEEQPKGYKVLKVFRVFNNYTVGFEDDGRQYTEFYYFVSLDMGDTWRHADSKLYKTERLLDSKVEEVTESEDKKSWLVKISHVPFTRRMNVISGVKHDYVKDLSVRETKVYKLSKY
ncbi:hypothetical protein [Aquimarina celericrescens]|uniref:Uncharacterized protein n=1 Tax=Aquimarina celericrescens TaxID=1964542 RepID=A0ABW5AZS1_9FLAO|nr:hypothetical protein [Aquimarina celericrescens]